MQDILATILLISIVVAAAVSAYTFVSSTLTNLFTSSETTFQLTLPLRIEKTLVQGTQTCFIVRNPNPEPVGTNTIAIYINGRLYTHTSDCNQVLPKSICRLCITYTPSGGEEVKISIGGGSSSSSTISQSTEGASGENVVLTWAKAFGGTSYDYAYSAQQTPNGGYLVAGFTASYGSGGYDALILKLDSNGSLQWAKTFGDTNDEKVSYIRRTSDGGYILTGYSESYGAGDLNVLLLKLDPEGNIQWAKTYGGPGNEEGWFVQQTSDNGYIVAGYTDSYGSGDWNALILKLDSNGSLQWAKTFGGTGAEYALFVYQTPSNEYVVTGYTSSYGVNGDALILKLDSNGSLQWAKTYGGTTGLEYVRPIQQTSDGGYIVAGYTFSYGQGWDDFFILKLDPEGNIQWAKTYGGTESDKAVYMQRTLDNSYIIAGITQSYGSGGYDALILKLDSNGSLQWAKTFGDTNDEWLFFVQQTSDSGYVLAGFTASYGSGSDDFLILKLDSEGNIPGCSALQDVTPSSTSPSVASSDITATIGTSDITSTIGSTSPSVTVQDVTPNETNICG